ncbi:MAG: DUF4389 domain-containing protein [Acidiferrobacterales bacterium]|nr:DUF4389 domain-containing protein [Acidiferrobacterales bacterium]
MEMDPEFKERVTAKPTWTRGLYILLFIVIYNIAEIVVYAVVILQFLFTLFGGDRNAQLQTLGKNLSTFIYQVFMYITYNTDERPYPFAPWPGEGSSSKAPAKKKKKAAKKKADTTGGSPDTGESPAGESSDTPKES